MDISTLSAFVIGFIECALWSTSTYNENGDMGDTLENDYDINDIDKKTLQEIVEECQDFQDNHADLLEIFYKDYNESQAGHDFLLTKNGHGAGFWDRGVQVGEELTKASKPYGPTNLYVGDNNKLYVE